MLGRGRIEGQCHVIKGHILTFFLSGISALLLVMLSCILLLISLPNKLIWAFSRIKERKQIQKDLRKWSGCTERTER